MDKLITCFIAGGNPEDINRTYIALNHSVLVKEVYVLQEEKDVSLSAKPIGALSLEDTLTLKTIAGICRTPYLLFYTKSSPLQLDPYALERFVQIGNASSAALLYSDYYEIKTGQLIPHPLIDYQSGSVRDDFKFGSVLFFSTESFK